MCLRWIKAPKKISKKEERKKKKRRKKERKKNQNRAKTDQTSLTKI